MLLRVEIVVDQDLVIYVLLFNCALYQLLGTELAI